MLHAFIFFIWMCIGALNAVHIFIVVDNSHLRLINVLFYLGNCTLAFINLLNINFIRLTTFKVIESVFLVFLLVCVLTYSDLVVDKPLL